MEGSATVFPASVFRAAGFSPRDLSAFDALRTSAVPPYEIAKCCSEVRTDRPGCQACGALAAPEAGRIDFGPRGLFGPSWQIESGAR